MNGSRFLTGFEGSADCVLPLAAIWCKSPASGAEFTPQELAEGGAASDLE
jgi:hypothetical protein